MRLQFSRQSAAALSFALLPAISSAAGTAGQFQFDLASQSVAEGAGRVVATVKRAGGSGGAATVRYTVEGFGASGGTDFELANGVLSWADGDGSDRQVTVAITNDTAVEAAEDFVIRLGNPAGGLLNGGATLGSPREQRVTIQDDDAPRSAGSLQLSAATQTVREGQGRAEVVVQRVGGAGGAATVRYIVETRSAEGGKDFAVTNGVLSWADGDAGDRYISIPLTDDSLVEGLEDFVVRIGNEAGGLGAGGIRRGTPFEQLVTIVDDEFAFSHDRSGTGCPFPNGAVVIERWQGTLGVNAGGLNQSGAADHVKSFQLPAACNIASLRVQIGWSQADADFDLEVTPPSGTVPGSANTNYPGNLAEHVYVSDPSAGSWQVRTVGYTTRNAPFTAIATVVVGQDAASACEAEFAGVPVGASVAAVDPGIALDVPGNLLLTFADAWSRDQALQRLKASPLLSATERAGLRAFRHLYTVKLPAARITPALIEGLRGAMDRLSLVSIWGEHGKYPHVRTSVPLIGVHDAREFLGTAASPLTGKGIGVAILDTGIDKTQGDLRKVVHNVRVLPTGGAIEAENTEVENGHGTHLAGTIVGDGTMSAGRYVGVAPDAHVVGIKVDAGSYLFVLEGIDYTIEQSQRFNIRVSNHSYGPVTGSGFRFDPASADAQAIKRLHDSGIIPVYSAGNLGPNNDTISDDAQNPCAIGVASGDRSFQLADSSSRGTPNGAVPGPDITAPGVNITASRAVNGFVSTAIPTADNPSYSTISGTSMAAPHVAGVIAIMLEANPALNFEQVRSILRSTARPMFKPNGDPYPEHEAGAGYIDALGAIAAAKNVPKPNTDVPVAVGGGATRVKHVMDKAGLYAGVVCNGCPVADGVTAPHVYEFVLPASLSDVRELRVRLDWTSPADHLSLEVFDPSGASAGSSTTVGVNSQEVVILPAAPSAAVRTGRYRIEATEFWLARAMDFEVSVSVVRDSGAPVVNVPRSAFSTAPAPACSDGSDNDGDGLTDHPADPGCSSAADTDEFNATGSCPFSGPGPHLLHAWDGNAAPALILDAGLDGQEPFTLPAACSASSMQITIAAGTPVEDLDLELTKPGGATETSANGGSTETLVVPSPAPGSYAARVYGFISSGLTSYHGEVHITLGAGPADADGDGVADATDNCVSVSNADQRNTDGDAQGDACDADDDADGVADGVDNCPLVANPGQQNTYGDARGDACEAPSGGAAQVVVAVIDSGINMYHEFWYADGPLYNGAAPAAVTSDVLADFNVTPGCQIELTRTGNFAADFAADAAKWSAAAACDVVWFKGTNVLAKSFEPGQRPYLPDDTDSSVADEDVHGTGVAAAALTGNPEAVILFVEGGGSFHTALQPIFDHSDAELWTFTHPAVDIVSTSYGNTPLISLPSINHNVASFQGVYDLGKLHFGAADNWPTVSSIDGTSGPWWTIAVSGYEEFGSGGRQPLSGLLPDFIADYTQDLPYCDNCQSGTYAFTAGTSFATPRSAGTVSKVLLAARRAAGHAGGIVVPSGGGRPLMVQGTVDGAPFSLTNWQLRRTMEEAAWIPGIADYDPIEAVLGLDFGVPLLPAPAAPLNTGWGVLSPDNGQVVEHALARLGLGDGSIATPRAKGPTFCLYQTQLIRARKAYWDTLAVESATWLAAPSPDPFEYCQ